MPRTTKSAKQLGIRLSRDEHRAFSRQSKGDGFDAIAPWLRILGALHAGLDLVKAMPNRRGGWVSGDREEIAEEMKRRLTAHALEAATTDELEAELNRRAR